MKPIRVAIFLSILVHTVFLLVLLTLKQPEISSRGMVEIQISIPEMIDQSLVHEVSAKPDVPAPQEELPTMPDDEENIAFISDSLMYDIAETTVRLIDILKENTDTLRLQSIRRYALYHLPIPDSLVTPSDSLQLALRLALFGKPLPIAGYDDNIGARLKQGQTGHGQLSNVTGLLGLVLSALSDGWFEKKPSGNPRITKEPTKVELHVLNRLWAEGERTDPELYSSLDSNVPITATGFNRILEDMVEKGFLTRKIVSPQKLMGIMTPIGMTYVELSEMNLRNQVYEYKNVLTKEDVMNYLHGQLFELKQKADSSNAEAEAAARDLKRLEEKLMLLFKSN